MRPPGPRERRSSHDRDPPDGVPSAVPGALISLIFLWWTGEHTPKVQWTLTVVIVAFCLGFAFALRERVVLPLQTLVEPARRARRGGLLHPRARRARRRSARRGDDRGQHARRDAAAPAPRRARGDHAAAQGDGGNRRRGLHLRRQPRLALREPRRRAAARAGARARLLGRRAERARARGLSRRRGRRASSTRRFPAASAAGKSAAARSARAGCPTSCSCSPT